MAKNPKILSIVLAGGEGTRLMPLTRDRAKPAVPFGGVFRLIDFPLSNLVNSGINKVGVVTKGNYQSLMDHLGSGKAWDLSRKSAGLFMLPPFGHESLINNSRVESLESSMRFLTNSQGICHSERL